MSEFKWNKAEDRLPEKTGSYLCWIVGPELNGFREDGTPNVEWREYAQVIYIIVWASDGTTHPVMSDKKKIVAWAEIPEVPEDILSNGRRYN